MIVGFCLSKGNFISLLEFIELIFSTKPFLSKASISAILRIDHVTTQFIMIPTSCFSFICWLHSIWYQDFWCENICLLFMAEKVAGSICDRITSRSKTLFICFKYVKRVANFTLLLFFPDYSNLLLAWMEISFILSLEGLKSHGFDFNITSLSSSPVQSHQCSNLSYNDFPCWRETLKSFHIFLT